MWRLNIISAVSAAHGRLSCTKKFSTFHVFTLTRTTVPGHQGQPINQSTNQSVAPRLFYFLCGLCGSCVILAVNSQLYNTHTLTRVETNVLNLQSYWLICQEESLSVFRRLPATLQQARPNISMSRKTLKRRGQMLKMLSYCKTKRAWLSAWSRGLCTAMKVISWVMIFDSKASIVAFLISCLVSSTLRHA